MDVHAVDPPAVEPPFRTPAAPVARRPRPLAAIGRVGRALRSRRLAIVLLVALTGLSLVGAVLPQQDRLGPMGYALWARANPQLARVAQQLSLSTLYSSWWFLALFALLYANTLACTIPQFRSAYHRVRQQPRLPAGSRRADVEVALETAPPAAFEAVLGELRRRGYHVSAAPARTVVARKGAYAAWGSPIFHLGLVILLTGAAVGGLLGFSGYVELAEGQGFEDAPGDYLQRSQGPLFDRWVGLGPLGLRLDGHQGFAVQMDRFEITPSNWGQGIASQLESEVTLIDRGQPVSKGTVRVNEPLAYAGRKLYQAGSYGLAPVFELRLGDGSVETGAVNLARRGPDHYENSLYLPDTSYRMVVRASEGARFVDVEVTERQQPIFAGRLEPGQSASINEVVLTFQELRSWAGFRVVTEPGAPLLYAGFALLVAGLALSFLLVRRDVWASVSAGANGAVLRLGGQSPRLRASLQAEIEEMADAVRALAGAASPEALPRVGLGRWHVSEGMAGRRRARRATSPHRAPEVSAGYVEASASPTGGPA